MVAIHHDVGGFGRTRRVVRKSADILVRAALVAFQRQNVVAALLDDLGGNSALAVERVSGHGAALERQQFQQLRHRRDLVGFAVHGQLAEQQPLLCGPGMKHVQRGLARRPGAHVSDCLACQAACAISFRISGALAFSRIRLCD